MAPLSCIVCKTVSPSRGTNMITNNMRMRQKLLRWAKTESSQIFLLTVFAMFLFLLIGVPQKLTAQTKLGLSVGLQPALRDKFEIPSSNADEGFSVFFMKHFTAGIFLRHEWSKHIYVETNISASIDAEWGYVRDGVNPIDEFRRAFDRPNCVHIDAPIYFGVYVLKKEIVSVRVFGCPQYKIRANTALNFSTTSWDNFTLNVGVGADLLSKIVVNVNYRIPFNYGQTSFEETKLAASIGFML